jgi:hypothetical protein
MTLDDARPVLAVLGTSVPPAIGDWTAADAETRWSSWLTGRAADIRARLAAGDEDSVVNLMLYGTRFTRWPRATPHAIAASAANVGLDDVMEGRVADLATAIESPGGDERLRFARQVVERHGIVVGASARDAARRYLTELRSRALSRNAQLIRRLAAAAVDRSQTRAAHATLYRDRGLSSDSSLRVDFALEQALAALRDRGEVAAHAVERVAIVGPGLDFLDKAQGYDFYPVQMIQPFAILDSLRRLELAERPALTAFDVSPRVVAHLRDARRRAGRGESYRLHLPLEQDPARALDLALVEHWRRFGDRLGTVRAGEVPAPYAGQVRARTIDVRPETVLDVSGAELDIVHQRLPDAGQTSRFDLIVATNILVYYDTFEQALAVSNMASMLRGGGWLLTNQPVPVPAECGLSFVLIVSVAFDRLPTETGPHERGDSIFVYRKS